MKKKHKPLEFKADGYLKSSRLGREGNKDVNFEFSAKDAVSIAKLELMGRDLIRHLPVLLEIKVRISPNNEKTPQNSPKKNRNQTETNNPKQRHYMDRAQA